MSEASTISGKIPFVGDRVQIVAADEFFAYCDGWKGTVQGLNEGLFEVECQREDGNKTLFVPGAQLAMLEGAAAV
jgi:hypothetical protein